MYRRWERRLRRALLADWRVKAGLITDRLRETGLNDPAGVAVVWNDAAFWRGWARRYHAYLDPLLREAALIGARATRTGAVRAQRLPRWKEIERRAAAWVRQYGADLIGPQSRRFETSLTDNDLAQIRRRVEKWFTQDRDFDSLVRSIRQVVHDNYRAELIAATESTRAYTAGSAIAWAEAELIDADAMEALIDFGPPAHPACRCWVVFERGRGVVWKTARDERVCAVCDPLHDDVLYGLRGERPAETEGARP